MARGKNSLSHIIVKSISIFGGVQAVNIICSLVRTKLIAVLIGPIGVGLFGIFNSVTEMIFCFTSLGIRNSSVRNLSESEGVVRKKMITAVRRWSWIVGIIGACITVLLSPLLSKWSFGDNNHSWLFMAVSTVLLFNSLTKGEEAILQGTTQLNHLARGLITGSIIGVIASAPIFWYLGEDSIVPSLIAWSVIGVLSLWFAGRHSSEARGYEGKMPLRETISLGKEFIQFGILLTLSNAITLISQYAFSVWLNVNVSTVTLGHYQAGYNLINRYADLLFVAMAMDFYPRLARAQKSARHIGYLFTKQANLTLALLIVVVPLLILLRQPVVALLYSGEFAVILPFVSYAAIGTVFRAISWCMAYIIIAKGNGKVYLCTETISVAVTLTCNILFYKHYGLDGIGISYIVGFAAYTLTTGFCVICLYGVKIHRSTLLILLLALIAPCAVLASVMYGTLALQILLTIIATLAGARVFYKVYTH